MPNLYDLKTGQPCSEREFPKTLVLILPVTEATRLLAALPVTQYPKTVLELAQKLGRITP